MSLRIKNAEFFLVKIPLRFSIEHALASRTANRTGFLVLAAEDGTLGIGEFLCREYVTGETLDDCLRYLKSVWPILDGVVVKDPLTLIQSLSSENVPSRGSSAGLCALELALLDLWGKYQGRAVTDILRPKSAWQGRTLTYSAVYPFARGLKLKALHFFYRTLVHFEHVKVKGTGNIKKDLDCVNAIRQAFSYPIDVRLDLNGALTQEDADEYFSRMLDLPHGVRWFEQPFPKDAWELCAKFQNRFGQKAVLCADESICTMDDLTSALKHRAFRAVNIRIAKHGGLVNSLKIYERALEGSLEAQLGCLVGESSVLSYAGAHFAALANPLRYYEGCFGKYLIQWDVIEPSLTFSRNGRVPLTCLPQTGLVPPFDLKRLRRQAFQSGTL